MKRLSDVIASHQSAVSTQLVSHRGLELVDIDSKDDHVNYFFDDFKGNSFSMTLFHVFH